MIIKNHASEIEKALHLDADSVIHEGNFIFSGKLNGNAVEITTKPVDEEQANIAITFVRFMD